MHSERWVLIRRNTHGRLVGFHCIFCIFASLFLIVSFACQSVNVNFIVGCVSDWTKMLEVNVVGLNQCTQLAIKSMIKVITNQFCWSKIENVPLHENNYLKLRYDYFQHKIDDGQIVMVNSMSGHRVAPGKLRFYSATKFAVTGLLEGWRQEVNK